MWVYTGVIYEQICRINIACNVLVNKRRKNSGNGKYIPSIQYNILREIVNIKKKKALKLILYNKKLYYPNKNSARI